MKACLNLLVLALFVLAASGLTGCEVAAPATQGADESLSAAENMPTEPAESISTENQIPRDHPAH